MKLIVTINSFVSLQHGYSPIKIKIFSNRINYTKNEFFEKDIGKQTTLPKKRMPFYF